MSLDGLDTTIDCVALGVAAEDEHRLKLPTGSLLGRLTMLKTSTGSDYKVSADGVYVTQGKPDKGWGKHMFIPDAVDTIRAEAPYQAIVTWDVPKKSTPDVDAMYDALLRTNAEFLMVDCQTGKYSTSTHFSIMRDRNTLDGAREDAKRCHGMTGLTSIYHNFVNMRVDVEAMSGQPVTCNGATYVNH